MGPPVDETLEKWLWIDRRAASDDGEGCVLWPWGTIGAGYGTIRAYRRMTLVTHLVLELSGSRRPPEPNGDALHSCDTPLCCNRRHLSWGSDADNGRQKAERGRGRSREGVEHHNAKLTPDRVREMRRLLAEGATLAACGNLFGVSKPIVARIRDGHAWKHVT